MDELAALRELRRDARVAATARADARRVLVEAMSRRRTRRGAVAVVALGAALLVVAGTAYALGIRIFAGEPAPESVKNEARLLNEVKGELIPRARTGPRVLADQTRAGAVLQASTGPVYLWVAPTASGGRCVFLHVVGNEQPDGRPNLSGGCDRGTETLDATFAGTRVRNGRWVAFVYGHARRPVERIEIALENGRRIDAPLSSGFFLVEVPHVPDGEVSVLEVVALAADGRVVARQRRSEPPAFPPRRVDVSGESPLLEILTRRTRKPIRLFVVGSGADRCSVLESPGGTGSSCGGRPPRPRELAVAPNQIGAAPNGMLLFWGEVGREIAALELRFEDGRVERLPLVRHWTLYQVDPADFAEGRRPIELVGRNADGDIVGRRPLGPWRSAGGPGS
jgi:hypothetical protein